MAWRSENTSNAVQAGGGIASSLINVIGQSYINRQNIEEQRRAQQVAQQNWREQQEYNSPRNQVSRIEQAGLNPDMLYGQSSAGVAGNAPTPAQSINPPVLNPIQLDPMTASNIYKNIAEISKIKEETRGETIENDVKDRTLLEKEYLAMGYTKEQTALLVEERLNVIEQRENIKVERSKMQQEIENLKQTYINLGLNAEILRKESHNLDLLAAIYIAQEIGLKLSNEEQKIINANKDAILKSEIYKNNSEAIAVIKNAESRESEVESSNKLRAQQTETEIEKTGEHKYAKEIKRIDSEYRETQNELKIVKDATESVKNVSESVDAIFSSLDSAIKLGAKAKGIKAGGK